MAELDGKGLSLATKLRVAFLLLLENLLVLFQNNQSWHSLFLEEVLLLLSVRLYCVLWQELHELQRFFDFHQHLIDFTTFDLQWTKQS